MGDANEIADILGDAFADDPVMRWTLGSSMSSAPMFRAMAEGIYLRHGFGQIADDGATALWLPANVKAKLPLMGELRLLFSVLQNGGFGALKRAHATEQVMQASHPEAPHYYLFAVGVREKMKGKGLGGRIIREGLKRADGAGAPAYLENSNPKNTPLYERMGFRPMSLLPLPAEAPPLLGMLRPAERSKG